MTGIQKKLETIAKQADKWVWFSKVSPILVVIIATAVFGINYASTPELLLFSWICFFLACVMWWIWVIKVIYEMTELFAVVFQLVTHIKNDLKAVKEDLEKPSID